MLNLLPQEEKKKLIKEYKMRFYSTLALFACLLFLIAIVGLFPSYISKRAEMQSLLDQKLEAEEKNSAASLEEADKLGASNKALAEYLVARISSLEALPSAHGLIEKIFAKKTSAISVTSIDVTATEVTIRGIAATRADLIAFHSSLRAEAEFKTATLPIADIAKSIDAPFAIQVILP